MPVHLREWVVAGFFFGVLSAAEVLLAVALLAVPSRRLLIAVAAVSIATVIVWAGSRIWGMPFGPAAGRPEVVGWPDSISTLFEAATALGMMWLLQSEPAPPVTQARRVAAFAAPVIAVALLTVVALWYVPRLQMRALPVVPRNCLSHRYAVDVRSI